MRSFLTVAFVAIFSLPSFCQPTTGQSGTGDNIDIKYHRFEWNIDPTKTKYISGQVTTYFVTTKSNVNRITFDLNRNSFNNGNLEVLYRGTVLSHSFPASGNRDVLTIQLPSALPIDKLDSVTIKYGGVPPAVNNQAEGCQQKSVAGYNLFYTLSESYEDKDWWPCKADMQDKIDSTDYIITTPAAYRPATNGVLVSEVTSGSNKVYTFKHRYPIASYLVAVAVTQYNVFKREPVNVNGTMVPIEYYISKGRSSNPTVQLNAMDFCRQEMVLFSNLFGDYPYKNEKYGMYEFGWGGGMEHQTNSAMSWNAMSSWGTIAHELAHQWFGNKVTMATWNELWLSEGFARYSEALAAEFIPSLGQSAVSKREGFKNGANGNAGVGCYIPNAYIANSNALWGSAYGSSVYERGAMVVSMLRTLMGDDKFFQACRNYLNDPQLAYNSATTTDLKAHFEAVLDGFDLTGFFNSFVYGNGYPNYGSGAGPSIKWQPLSGGNIRFRVDLPAKSAGSNVDTYYSVIPLRVRGAGGAEKMVVLYHQGNAGVSIGGDGITFGNSPTPEVNVGFTPTSVDFDPYHMSLARGVAQQMAVLPVSIMSFEVMQQPNGNLASLHIAAGQNPTSVVLQRSADGTHYSHAGDMRAAGDGRYYFDDGVRIETTFYRVMLTEATGEVTYSPVVKISGRSVASVSLLSNPVRNQIMLRIPASLDEEVLEFSIYDGAGRKWARHSRRAMNGTLQLEAGNLPNGTYLLQIQSVKAAETIKFVINK